VAKQRYHDPPSYGFVFGKYNNDYVLKPETEDGHIMIVGGVGSGKSTCIAIPTLRSWRASIFAIDIKGELSEYAKQYIAILD